MFGIRFEIGSGPFFVAAGAGVQAGSLTMMAPTMPASFVPWIEQ
jgi:hypothetical protein